MTTVWLLGDAVVDLIPDGAHYLRCPGGAPANVAVAIARLGGESAFIGKVGADPFGRFMARTLQAEGVATTALYLDETQRTSTVVVELDEHGERSFTFMVNPSADQFLTPAEIPHFAPGQWLHCCSIALLNEPSRSATHHAIAEIKRAGGFVSFDPNLRESLWPSRAAMLEQVRRVLAHCDVIKLSEEEACLLAGQSALDEAIAQLRAQYPTALLLVTLGAQGAQVCFKAQSAVIPSITVQVVDTTGAGDAFVGGLLAALSQHAQWQNWETIVACVRQGAICGALATTAKGAMSALPDSAAVQAQQES
ncbi:aminoimidazole riboside kinase [Pasteurellaceae bacterium 20609_3]|uniref:aminoimidazole riboside kinase n=1 Tax=Spirabiliibacterium mucosae TaxID=28156 RepID=UPI001AAD87BC|nr:aminoimidazole riboside kinase [Spirabiliibacterium mucosae]MBE2899177.1 aminoimidazole riboside kinase [Spirabiliibacterium mucosae]